MPVLTGIDHVILAVADPAAAGAELEVGLGLASGVGPATGGGGRHEAHGTHNHVFWLGDSYIELMGVFDSALAADSWWGRVVLERLAVAPAGLAGVVFATDDLAADIVLLRGRGSPISDPEAGERIRSGGDAVRWRMGRLPAADSELGLIFLIEHDTSAAEWRPADRAARADGPRLVRVEVGVADMRRVGLRLLRELGIHFRPSLAGGGARDASIGAQTLRLVAGAGRPTIVLRGGSEARDVELLGARWQVLPI